MHDDTVDTCHAGFDCLPSHKLYEPFLMGRNTRRKRLLRSQVPPEPPRAAINLLDLPHDILHEILLHLQPADRYQWHEIQDRCFVRPPRVRDVVAFAGTCKALRRVVGAVQLRVLCVRSEKRDMKRTLKVLSERGDGMFGMSPFIAKRPSHS